MDEESAISGGEETVEPGQILVELGGECEGSLFRALPESIQHPVQEQAGRGTHLRHVEQLDEKGVKLLYFSQLVGGEGDCHGDGVELEAEPHHNLSWWRGFMSRLPEAQLNWRVAT